MPVISPLPFKEYWPAKTGIGLFSSSRGTTAVTPVRILFLGLVKVVKPTFNSGTSVMELFGPVLPGKGSPKSLARFILLSNFKIIILIFFHLGSNKFELTKVDLLSLASRCVM